MKKKNSENIEWLEQKEEELKQEFKDLTKIQRELLLYRKIAEIGKLEDDTKNDEKELFSNIKISELLCLIKAGNIGYLKPFMVYSTLTLKLEYQDVYKESIISYNNVLENYKRLAQELNLNSSLDLSNLLSYMLWNGYFSVNKKHFYNLQGRLLLPGLNSFDIIKGKGVCLAYAELLDNYLSICGKESSILSCKVPENDKSISFDYRPKIERNIKINTNNRLLNNSMLFCLKGLINKFGNHAITLIWENGNIYAYDPTNFYVLNIKDFSVASIINGTGEFQIKPLATFIMNPYADSNHIFEKLLSGDIKSTLTRKEFIFSFENLIELMNSNISLLDDAYDNIHNDLEYINKQTNEIGNSLKVLKKNKNRR